MNRINCQFSNGCFCENKLIKRSWFGFGDRICIETKQFHRICKLKKEYEPQKAIINYQRFGV